MKKILIVAYLVCFSIMSFAQNKDKPELAKQRANRLSNQMIQDLRLNNFQAKRLREINQEKVSKMMAIEQKFANNPDLVEKNCQGVCRERDKELESFLSVDQYSKYYGNRSEFYKYDKDFAKNIGLVKSTDAKSTSQKSANAGQVLRPTVNR
ncbi:hypothetical protein [Adhaeribacter pallidiroseus]|uniref:Uncharacterized protein n=1 Tax=Adhaeribacter pallidiroseus TaxID=2072847 RepID=A0A369QAP7_9BACT|nr:hypothetical protein [Adhaeribacter pallidiroseus]RDC61993.1 hypothetical protein AHMF7616_00583 [Adhaeribacter pallidiroseus]